MMWIVAGIGLVLWLGFCLWMAFFLAAGNLRADGDEDEEYGVAKVTPEQVISDDLLVREIVARAASTGKIVVGNRGEDGKVIITELEQGVDWPDERAIDEMLEIDPAYFERANAELHEVRIKPWQYPHA